MDNAQKAIMIGVGLFITIIIISAVMLITSAGQDMINDSTQQVGNISSSLQAQLTSQFDETILTGSQVISAIKTYNTTEGFVLDVVNKTSAGEKTTHYGMSMVESWNSSSNFDFNVKKIKSNTPVAVGKLTDKNNAGTYVPSNAKYKAHLLKLSGTVVGIYFRDYAYEQTLPTT